MTYYNYYIFHSAVSSDFWWRGMVSLMDLWHHLRNVHRTEEVFEDRSHRIRCHGTPIVIEFSRHQQYSLVLGSLQDGHVQVV